jgi:hypothetical protein
MFLCRNTFGGFADIFPPGSRVSPTVCNSWKLRLGSYAAICKVASSGEGMRGKVFLSQQRPETFLLKR